MGQDDFYASRIPGPADILLIIEAAESSLEYDHQVKAPLYARSNITDYWVVDVDARVLWCYAQPAHGRYTARRRRGRSESVTLTSLSDCPIGVESLFAP